MAENQISTNSDTLFYLGLLFKMGMQEIMTSDFRISLEKDKKSNEAGQMYLTSYGRNK